MARFLIRFGLFRGEEGNKAKGKGVVDRGLEGRVETRRHFG